MSPLRPPLLTIHPRPPRPQAVRGVTCPQCGHGFAVSRRAMVLRCPACTAPMRFEDFDVRSDHRGELTTMGQIRIRPRSAMVGKLVCGELVNQGRFDGQAMVHGPVELLAPSMTTGEIHARSLKVWMGASLRAKARIAPQAMPAIVVTGAGKKPRARTPAAR